MVVLGKNKDYVDIVLDLDEDLVSDLEEMAAEAEVGFNDLIVDILNSNLT